MHSGPWNTFKFYWKPPFASWAPNIWKAAIQFANTWQGAYLFSSLTESHTELQFSSSVARQFSSYMFILAQKEMHIVSLGHRRLHVTNLSHLLLTKGQKQCIIHTINTVLEESPGYRRLKTIKDPRKQKKVRVATFLTSNKDSTRGIVPIVQSQHNSEGLRRSQAFTGRR